MSRLRERRPPAGSPRPQAARAITTGGWRFPADPALTAVEQPIFWRPEADPQTVLLEKAPHAIRGVARFVPESWPGRVIERPDEHGRHFIVRGADGDHRVWAPIDLEVGDPITVTIALSDDAPIQAEAALRFWRRIGQGRAGGARRALDLRTQRTRTSLRALDARQAGASYRDLAQALFGPDRVEASDWKTCSLRDTTIRLVRCGLALMKGDYRRLMRRTSAS